MTLPRAIYHLRELVTEQDPRRRMEALLEWERRWVKTLHVETFVDRLLTAHPSARVDVYRHMEERALRQLGDEVAKVAEREQKVWDGGADRILHSIQVLTDKDPESPTESPK